MIFACDLDQTLIYSRKSMGLFDADELTIVEYYEGEPLSFMSNRAMQLLRLLDKQLLFVPATTRTLEQYRRVFGIADELAPRYAITGNGGTVLIDGTPDESWRQQVLRLTGERCASFREIDDLFGGISSDVWVRKRTLCEETFFTILIERDRLPEDVMERLHERLPGLGWNCSLQGRKLYLMPDTVSKGAAVAYVMERSGSSALFAAGDSLLDESMLRIADDALAPVHGELYRRWGTDSPFRFTEQSGIRASEEILLRLLSRMEVSEAL